MTTINYIKENGQVNEFVATFGIIVKKGKKSFAVGFESSKFFNGENVEFMAQNIKILSSGIKSTPTLISEIKRSISKLNVNYIKLYEGTNL